MPGNVRNQNSASNQFSNIRNSAFVAGSGAIPSSGNYSSNFRGSKRVSHRRSQHSNTDQHSKTQVNNNASVYPNVRVTTNGCSNVLQPKIRLFYNDSNQSGRNAGYDGIDQVVGQFGTLQIQNNRRRDHGTRKTADFFNYELNFRHLELYPTIDDIHRSGLPLLEPNLLEGAYNGTEHYLNVHFRLTREDFVGSVREGIQGYRNVNQLNPLNPSQFKYDGVRVYPKTQFERIQSTKSNKLGILVNFDPVGRMRNFKWKESKRFMFGSLLLFTRCNFNEFFHCTVIERDIDALRAGKILVSLPDKAVTDSYFFKRPFLMAECEAFFDPYLLVMKLLRELDESTFPMKKYIVQGAVDPQYPTYLNDFGVLRVYDRIIAPITLDDGAWPSAVELKLDQFQFRALKAALTREFCVIQGPPGTGKTFIGLKIVQNIWQNAKQFNLKLKLPILVVCSANHAVDQFLEGVLKFTKNVVRVGGQSRSEVMKKYNLRERVAEKKFFFDKELRGKIRCYQREIDKIGLQMKCAENPTGILSSRVLANVVGPNHLILTINDQSLVNWLLPAEKLGKQYDDLEFIKFKSRHETKKVMPAKKPDEEDEDEVDVEEEEPLDPKQKTSYEVDDRACYAISLQELKTKCLACIDRYYQLKKANNYGQMSSCKNEIIRIMMLYDNLEECLKNAVHNEDLCVDQQLFYRDPKSLKLDQRWLIYWQWALKLVGGLVEDLNQLRKSHSECVQQLEECRQQQDLEVMRRADVIGMTTSGAARLNTLLKSLHPAVVVIEEAGEVLETHVIASLTNECQHVILIGDHEQLKPITAVYELSKSYNMNVSLFERMVKNGMDCPVLNVQHRMRPEISCLISPLIYKDLKNHESVRNFESIRGVEKDVFFVDHTVFENTTTDSSSKRNEFEANFIVHLTKYLIQQQYDPTQITILTTYADQRTLIRNLLKQFSVDSNVKCVVVDKYQGEENEIVLLSLVRSNANGNIGFLDTKNRVCVALSRARKGFFMIGNMSCLAKRSSLWQHIRKTLQENNAIGKLPLYCSIHQRRTLVASSADFALLKDGGCDQICNYRLNCGHVCRRKCHYTSGDHPQVKCCLKELKTLRPCGHEIPLECSKEPISKNCNLCRVPSTVAPKNSRGQYNIARNHYQDSFSRHSFGGSPSVLKHSYSFTPSIVQKRRSIFSSCCLL